MVFTLCACRQRKGRGTRGLLLVLFVVGLFGVGGGLGRGGLQTVHAQEQTLTVHAKSQFWIQGEATTHDFTCRVRRVEGRAELPPAEQAVPSSGAQASRGDGSPDVIVRVPVQAFDCGGARMTRDLQETLKMEEHPEIRFELVHASVETPSDLSGRWRVINALGALTIAGTKRLVRLEAKGHALDENRFRVRGCKPVRMSYFHIDPPTKAFGLVKVKDRVEVQFDLLAHTPDEAAAFPFNEVSIDHAPSCSSD